MSARDDRAAVPADDGEPGARPAGLLAKLMAAVRPEFRGDVLVFDPHWFRHSAATRMLRDGVPVEVVSKVLGHSSVTTTMAVYGHLTAEDARKALEAAGWFSATGSEVTW